MATLARTQLCIHVPVCGSIIHAQLRSRFQFLGLDEPGLSGLPYSPPIGSVVFRRTVICLTLIETLGCFSPIVTSCWAGAQLILSTLQHGQH